MTVSNDRKIIESWARNASPWTKAIRENRIESRKRVTNKAIIDALLSVPGKKVLDVGCGEGWLARELSALGFDVTGIDAIAGLVDQARELGEGYFQVLKYEDINPGTLAGQYDIAVCNFSLLGKESVEHVFKVMPGLLNTGGHFIVQTLHPEASSGDMPYQDGWRAGSWEGFGSEFTDPAPWYFRTVESWQSLFASNGFVLKRVDESTNPGTHNAASLIMVGRAS